MTEAEWRSSNDVERLLIHLWGVFPEMEWADRKPTLLFCACGKSVQHLLPPVYTRLLIEMERGADGRADSTNTQLALDVAGSAITEFGDDYSTLIFALGYGDLGLFGYETARIISKATGEDFDDVRERIDAQHSHFIRDIFGDPARSAPQSRLWAQANPVQQVAREIYDSGTFERVPELREVLRQAGGTVEPIFDHFRGRGPHVRGCWAIDLLLGKS